MKLLAIDPGPTRSAYLMLDSDDQYIDDQAIVPNEVLLLAIRDGLGEQIVIEKVEAFGMAVGAEVFETVYWSGRFHEAAAKRSADVDRIGRKAVKIHLCGSMRAKDPNIRQALIDRFGGPDAIGKKATPGPLYGIAGDVWSALAVAVTWADQHE